MQKTSCLPDGALLQGGKYRIVRFLGAGGFGCTYEAVFELLGERVAIKEFFPHELCNRDATGRMSVGTDSRVEFVDRLRRKFVEEARTLFRHKGLDGVVKVSDVFEENGTSYFVMDYIDGQSLRRLIDSRGPLPEDDALRIAREAGHALQSVHARGCLHLDIKPDNIMIASDGHPVLIDFGVSKQYSDDDGCNTSTLMGATPGYAPIEQMKGNVKTFLPATDVYALGATLYAMLSGKTPPDASDLLNDDDSLALPAGVSAATRAAIEAAMQSRVKDRPASVADFLAMLPNGGGAKTKPVDAPKTQLVTPKPPRRPRYLWAIAAGIVIAIAAIAFWKMKLAPSPAADDSDTILVAEEIVAEVDSVPAVQTIPQAIAQAQQAPAQSTQTAPATEPQSAKPEKQEAQEPQPVPIVTAPAASAQTETAMIAAYTDDGKYRAYTVSDWDNFTDAQKAKLQPVGVQLTAKGQQFIVAPTDAAGGKEVMWEDKGNWENFFDNQSLVNISDIEGAKQDFSGQYNTKVIRSHGRAVGVSNPAAEAAHNYSVKGRRMDWYLPAAGQLHLICENRTAINKVLKGFGGLNGEYIYWSSTEKDSAYAWPVGMYSGVLDGNSYKFDTFRVRAVAPVPSSSPKSSPSSKPTKPSVVNAITGNK